MQTSGMTGEYTWQDLFEEPHVEESHEVTESRRNSARRPVPVRRSPPRNSGTHNRIRFNSRRR